MYQGEAEVAWATVTKDGDVVIAFRVVGGGGKLGVKQGDRLTLTLSPLQPKAKPPGVRTKLAALAGRWCRDESFQQWLAATFPREHIAYARQCPAIDVTEADRAREIAAAVVRYVCEVKSRIEFDTDALAGERFGRLIRLPYHEWLNRSPPVHVQEGISA